MPESLKQSFKESSEADVGNDMEYVRYAVEIERTIHRLHEEIAGCCDPKKVAMAVMETIARFYDADWCGIIHVDLDVGVWTPLWWYDAKNGPMAPNTCQEFELSDNCGRWLECLKTRDSVKIPDVEEIKESNPEEYKMYQRLGVQSVLAVPFWKNPMGFLTMRNPKRYQNHRSLLRLLNHAVISAVTEYFLMETNKLAIMSPRIEKDTDVYISMFGELKITTSRGVLTEQELKSPKIVRMLVYLLLSQKAASAPREIVDAIWPHEESDTPGKNLKGLVYRLQQSFSLISDFRLIESTSHGYQINPKLNVFTDIQLFERKWRMALNAPSTETKAELLKKAVDLYNGDLLRSASSEHWIIGQSVHYQHRYIGAVTELLKTLHQDQDYHCVHRYAAKALAIVPHSADIYYWLIHAIHKQGHTEIARSELRTAKHRLLDEDYEMLENRLAVEANMT